MISNFRGALCEDSTSVSDLILRLKVPKAQTPKDVYLFRHKRFLSQRGRMFHFSGTVYLLILCRLIGELSRMYPMLMEILTERKWPKAKVCSASSAEVNSVGTEEMKHETKNLQDAEVIMKAYEEPGKTYVPRKDMICRLTAYACACKVAPR